MASGLSRKPSRLTDSLESLVLDLRDNQPDCITSIPQGQMHVSNPIEPDAMKGVPQASFVSAQPTWMQVQEEDLIQLVVITQKTHALHTLKLRAYGAPSPKYDHSLEEYLPLSTLRSFLSLENLGVLELNLCGQYPIPSGPDGSYYHVCPAIGALLPRLQSLHLRIYSICHDASKLQVPNDSIRLHTVVICLGLVANMKKVMWAANSIRCGPAVNSGFPSLETDMREQVKALTTRMLSPRAVKMLAVKRGRLKTESLDILTGKVTFLSTAVTCNEDSWINVEKDSSE